MLIVLDPRALRARHHGVEPWYRSEGMDEARLALSAALSDLVHFE